MSPSARRLLSTAKKPVAHCSTCKTDADSLANSLGNMSLRGIHYNQISVYLMYTKHMYHIEHKLER